jgi:2-iminobutanoate/2-iminopropanoate deaminase
MRKIITSKNAPAPIGPYSHGVLMGNTLFVSGQVGKNPISGELMLSDIKTETRQVMENVKGILTDAGMDFSHVCKTTIFLTDMNDFASVNEIYGSYLDGQAGFPARETVQVTKLPLNVNVEISVIAIK